MDQLAMPNKKYDPNNLIDAVIDKMQLKDDRGIAKLLKVETPIIANVRNSRLPLGGYLFIKLSEVTGMSAADLQDLMGDRRRKFRMSGARVRALATQALS
ncbi:MAG: hypothetical protein ACXW2U_17510 [Telluria sp.]